MNGLAEFVRTSLDEVKSGFPGSTNTAELISFVKQLLPLEEDIITIFEVKGNCSKCCDKVSCRISSVSEIESFV